MRTARLQNAVTEVVSFSHPETSETSVPGGILQHGTMQSNYNAAVATGTVRFQCIEGLYFPHRVKFDRRVCTILREEKKKKRFYI